MEDGLIGGAAPAASAVLAVFMGELGLGGLYLGKRVEGAEYPGRWYAMIEAGITVATLLSPGLMLLIRPLYIATGGVQTLGLGLATVLQVRAAEAWGDYPQWDEQVLRFRRNVFKQAGHPGLAQAERDLEKWTRTLRRRPLQESTEGKSD